MIRALRRRILDRFVLRPSRHPLAYGPKLRRCATHNGVVDEYFVQFHHSDDPKFGTSLEADPEVDLLVLKFPGTGGRAERASIWPGSFLPGVRSKVVSWNAPGYGGSSGRPSLTQIPPRADQFVRFVLGEHVKRPLKVWLVGNSLGCATVGYLASQPELAIDGVLLRNPPPLIEVVQRVASRYPLGRLTYPVAESLVAEMDLMQTAPRVRAPTVILQSELDELVPPASQQKVYELLSGEKRLVVMKGLGHGSLATDEHEPAISQAVRWLWDRGTVSQQGQS